MIDTQEKLDQFLQRLLKDYPESYRMYHQFLFTEWTDLSLLFMLYPIEGQNQTKEWILEYGSSWMNVAYPYKEFLHTLEIMANKWELSDSLQKMINNKKSKLETYFNATV